MVFLQKAEIVGPEKITAIGLQLATMRQYKNRGPQPG
jgi:hypothetical protein